jgi:GNAT superfamily N-acetyltransferase
MTNELASSTPSIDEDRAIALLTLAFATDAANRWTWPDAREYLEIFPTFARALGGRAFAHGTAYASEDYVAVSLWLPPGVGPDEEALVELAQTSVAPERQDDLFAMFEQMGGLHPTEPHWYLPFIGVDPAHQNRGHGAALMRPALERCDRDDLPAYLESSDRRNIPFYERLGFEVMGKIQSGSSPEVTPMMRRPRS